MAYTKYSLTPANNTAAPPDGAPEGMLPSAVNDTMRDMMSQIRDVGDGIRGGTYTMTAPVITGGSIGGATVTGGSINNTPIGASTRAAGSFTTITGTNDASISGLTVGKGGGAVGDNVAVGYLALNANTTGATNTVVGSYAGQNNTTGAENAFFGRNAGNANTTGGLNTGLGRAALNANSTGGNNTAVGGFALGSNTTASNNTAVGYQAGYNNTTGAYLTAIGQESLRNNTTGSYSTAVGYWSAYSNTTGIKTSIGYQSLFVSTTGTQLVAVGMQSLYSNSTGNYNTAIGDYSLYANTTASNNTAVGYQAGYSCTVSPQNTFIGVKAGYTFNATTGGNGYNTLVGYRAGFNLTTGYGNTFIGSNNGTGLGSGDLMTTGNNNTILGAFNGNSGGLDIRTASNRIVLSDGDGNPRLWINQQGDVYIGCTADPSSTVAGRFIGATSYDQRSCGTTTTTFQHFYFTNGNGNVGTITTNGSSTAYNTSSDYRLKENVTPMTGALAKVALLKPVTYKWKADGSNGEGFIAHELQEVMPDCVTGVKDEVDSENNPIYQAVDVSFLVATLTAAIQELKAEVDSLKQQLGK